jgi:hypothetical protein
MMMNKELLMPGYEYYTTEEAAARCGLDKTTARKHAADLGVPFSGSGRRKIWLWQDEHIEALKQLVAPRKAYAKKQAL